MSTGDQDYRICVHEDKFKMANCNCTDSRIFQIEHIESKLRQQEEQLKLAEELYTQAKFYFHANRGGASDSILEKALAAYEQARKGDK